MRPILVINPRGDQQFTEQARVILQTGVTDPRAMQRQLRAAYPASVVRPRELSSESAVIWYVYRDGRWTPDETTQEVDRDGTR
ncbi:MAG: hypothetical protein WEC14_02695 [Chloroflexota bacterium]